MLEPYLQTLDLAKKTLAPEPKLACSSVASVTKEMYTIVPPGFEVENPTLQQYRFWRIFPNPGPRQTGLQQFSEEGVSSRSEGYSLASSGFELQPNNTFAGTPHFQPSWNQAHPGAECYPSPLKK